MNKVISEDKAGNRTETEPVFTQEREPFGPVAQSDESAVQQIEDRMVATGVDYSGTVVTEQYHSGVGERWMSLREVGAAGGKISRLRLLREMIPGRGWCYDVSYVHATLPSGEIVHVQEDIPTGMHLIPTREFKGALIEWATEHAVFAKGLGLLDESNWATLG